MKYAKLWLLVILFAGADIATTVHGITNLGATEGNPVAQGAIDNGGLIAGLVALKIGALLIGGALQRICPEREWVVPSAFIVVWVPVVLNNLLVLF